MDLATLTQPNLVALARDIGATVRSAAIGAWAVVLGRYSGRDEVVVGVERGNGAVLPSRLSLTGDRVARWLAAVEARLSDEEDRASVSLGPLAGALGVDPSRVMSSAVLVDGDFDAIDVPLALRLGEDGLAVEFDSGRFEPAAIERMCQHVATVLTGMAASPEAGVKTLPILTEGERHRLVVELNDTAHEFPRDRCFHELVEDSVDRAPDATAVIFGERSVSYAELDQRANRLAHYLREMGVGPDTRVGIFAERSVEMVVGIVGILKAGGAFTPLDPKYPAERLAFMMEDADAPVLLTQAHLAERIDASGTRVVRLDEDWPEIDGRSDARPDVEMDPEKLAYVIYTSGSTGRPKGVAIRHRGSVNNVYDLNTRFEVGPSDRMLVLSSLSFDMCVYEVLGTLMAGGTMIMPQPDRVGEPAHWAELIQEHGVTVWNSAPQLLEMLVDHTESRPEIHPRTLRLAILGGDWVPVTLPDRFKAITAPDSRFIVLGGATECSIHSTIFEVEETDPDWTSIPYGRPQWNQSCFVLDPHRRLVPAGVPGELHLGGEGLGRGYLGRPELTEEKFIPHPVSDSEGDRLYRTGDLVRMDETGLIELLGRIDFMVKIRGFRIELGEIEAVLRSHDGVKEAVVLARDDEAGDQQLVAYVVPRSGGGGVDDDTVAEQVGRWQEVYETTYASFADGEDDPTFNIAGWNSSYTGEPIPAEDMRAWVETTVERISALSPRSILEIGCGTGLLLFRLAGECERYVGTDFSRSALEHVERHKAPLGLDHVETMLREARDFSGLPAGSFDVVVLNSIILQFPDLEYVVEVLRGAAKVLRPGGAVFVGDVRHLPTLETYHASVQIAQAPAELPRSDVRRLVAQRMAQEEELLMDPDFFRTLTEQIEELDRCVVQVKRGRYRNELSRYRYDATLFRKGGRLTDATDPVVMGWEEVGSSLDGLRDLAEEGRAPSMVVRGVPNARLARDRALVRLLEREDGPETAGEIRSAAASESDPVPGLEPQDVFDLSGAGGYDFDVRLGPEAEPETFDVVLRDTSDGSAATDVVLTVPSRRRPLNELVNHPMREVRQRDLVPVLRRLASSRLPDYMVPGAFMVVDRLPLTPNGKIDRKALPAPPTTRGSIAGAYVEPRTTLERMVANIWAEVLGLEKVGATDGFLFLGGHSLKATQIASRLRDAFGLHVPLKLLLQDPTVESFAGEVETLGKEQGVRVGEIAEILLEVQSLSDEDVEELLSDEADQPVEEAL